MAPRADITPCDHPTEALEQLDTGLRCNVCRGRWVFTDPAVRFLVRHVIARCTRLEVILGELVTATGFTLCGNCEKLTAEGVGFELTDDMVLCLPCTADHAAPEILGDKTAEGLDARQRLAAHLQALVEDEDAELDDEERVRVHELYAQFVAFLVPAEGVIPGVTS